MRGVAPCSSMASTSTSPWVDSSKIGISCHMFNHDKRPRRVRPHAQSQGAFMEWSERCGSCRTVLIMFSLCSESGG